MGKKPKKLEITKTVDTANRLKGKRKGAILKEEVWETDNGQVVKYVLAYINPRICGPDNGRVLGYDNRHDYHHRHFLGTTEPVDFVNYEALAERFRTEVKELFERSLGRARKIDRGEKLIPEITLTFEDPAEMMQLLSTQRVRMIECLRKNSVPISELATILKRDRKAVSRDVKLLESFGLVKTHDTPNPGHGKMKVVETLAAKYQLVATI